MPMPPALLAAIERKKKGNGGKPMGKSKPMPKGKPDNAAEDKLDGGVDDAMESGGKMMPGMSSKLHEHMMKNHGKK